MRIPFAAALPTLSLFAAFATAGLAAEYHPTAPAAAKSDAAAAPQDKTRYTLTLNDAGTVTGVILSKSPTAWTVKTDDNQTVEIARVRIRQVRPAPALDTENRGPDQPKGDKPQGDKPQGDKPQGDRPHGDKPQGDRPQGDKPQGDRPQGDKPQGDKPQGDKPQGDKPQGDRPGKAEVPGGGAGPKRVTVHLKDGRTITGTVEKLGDKGGVIKTDKGELVEIHKDQVQSIE